MVGERDDRAYGAATALGPSVGPTSREYAGNRGPHSPHPRPGTPPRTRSGWPLTVPPLVILWVGERPLAVRLRSVVAISRFPTNPRLANLIEGESSAMGFAIERMPEAGLWRLFSQPPRPRRVGL